jgi:hypothetical protein
MLPKVSLYAGSVDEAYDCVCLFRLTKCDPVPEPLWIYEFTGSGTLIPFVLAYGTDGWLEGDTVIVPDSRKNEADDALQRLNIPGVATTEMFALQVWGNDDEAVFDALFA